MPDKSENVIQARKFNKWGVEYRENGGCSPNLYKVRELIEKHHDRLLVERILSW